MPLLAIPPLPLTASLSTEPETKLPVGGITGHHNPMLHDNLSKIIRWYKGYVSFESRKINGDFTWQSRFHDHIIRNEKSFHTISEYIADNPLKWKADKFYPLVGFKSPMLASNQ